MRMYANIGNTLPKINPDIISGISASQTINLDQELHAVFQCAAESFPPGLKYHCSKRCTPEETFAEMTKRVPRTFELSHSDVYLCKFLFSYNGVMLRPKHIYLPFLDRTDILTLNGTLYQLTPVLGGKVFNVERGNVYLHLPRQRLGFKPFPVSCYRDNKLVNENAVYSLLHNKKGTHKRSNLYPSLVHYILCKYGLTRMFKEQYNADIIITNQEHRYSSEQYHVYRSNNYNKSHQIIKLLIPKEQHYRQLDSIIGAVFYIINHSIEATSVLSDLDKPELWIHLLDRFIFKGNTKSDKYQKTVEHLNSVEKYYDGITRRIMTNNNIKANNIYDLFRYITINYQDLNIHHGDGSMYNKELNVTKYLLYNVIYNVFSTMYAICLLPPELLTANKIESIFNKKLNPAKIFTTKGHGELTALSTGLASDCMLFGGTGKIITHNQATATGSKRGRTTNLGDTLLSVHPTQIAVASYLWITSSNPPGRGYLNPFVQFNQGWVTAPNQKLAPLVNNLEKLISKRIGEMDDRH